MKPYIQIQFYKCSAGELILGAYKEQLCICDWRYRKMRGAVDNRIMKALNTEFEERETDVLYAAQMQLDEYFSGTREIFEIPLLLIGSDFQKQVWNALLNIPYGEKRSYLQLSKAIGNVKAIRAVASANGANALAVFVPCHRIVGSNGKLVGYAGGLKAKQQLLNLEASKKQYALNLFNDL